MPDDADERFEIPCAETHPSHNDHAEEIAVGHTDRPSSRAVPPARPVRRSGYGTLRGDLTLSPDRDSDDTNAEIAREFGMPP